MDENIIQKQKNLSILELLVVVAIIIVLVLISIVALNDQRIKSRDAKRISDIRQIRTALEFYNSNEGQYPTVTEIMTIGISGRNKLCSKTEGGFIDLAGACKNETTYMSKIPADPLNNTTYQYLYTGDANGYDLIFTTEKDSSIGPAGTYHAHSESIDNQFGNK